MSTLIDDMMGLWRRHLSSKDRMSKEVADAVVAHAKKSFDQEGFSGTTFKAWRERKRPLPQKILTGNRPHVRMKNAIKVTKARFPNIEVKVMKPYADIHQDGDGRVPQRQFMSKGYGKDSPVLDREIDNIIDRHIKRTLNG